MAEPTKTAQWSSRWVFILAVAGSAVGLGNIWKFPYMAGESGGAAFILIYLACIAILGLPILLSELFIGRHTQKSPINALNALISTHKLKPFWKIVGWSGSLAGFLILSFYSVIAGWALHYVVTIPSIVESPQNVSEAFTSLTQSAPTLLFWHSIFMLAVMFTIANGVNKGIETCIKLLMPSLLGILMLLVIYSAIEGDLATTLQFMFSPDFSKITSEVILDALSHAFFSLSLGMGALMAYGAYVPKSFSLKESAVIIAMVDTGVALLAGLAIFPIVFQNALQPEAGPGLLFITLPLAFASMPFGTIFGILFFLLTAFAAFTSAISLTEPLVSYLVEKYNACRKRVSVHICAACWLLGIGSALSFGDLSGYVTIPVVNLSVFDFLDKLTTNIMLPLGGLCTAVFVGYCIPKEAVFEELNIKEGPWQTFWSVAIRFVVPIGITGIFIKIIFF